MSDPKRRKYTKEFNAEAMRLVQRFETRQAFVACASILWHVYSWFATIPSSGSRLSI